MPATTQLPGILQGVRGKAAQSQHLGAGLPPASPKVALHVELQISSDLQWLQPKLVEMSGQNRSAAATQELGPQHPAPTGVLQPAPKVVGPLHQQAADQG